MSRRTVFKEVILGVTDDLTDASRTTVAITRLLIEMVCLSHIRLIKDGRSRYVHDVHLKGCVALMVRRIFKM